MSRAVNKSVAEPLNQARDPAAAYEAISNALADGRGEDRHGELLEVEILGKSHPLEPGIFLLRDGNAIAVSKYGLVQAFFVARKLLERHLSFESTLSPDELLAVTSVVLLMDPEHLTAANARKNMAVLEAAASEERLLVLIEKDGVFIDSMLTSRLHRHTKSPTLWSHRRWLVQTAGRHGVRHSVAESLEKVVMVAGERHPRNYYAWCHARWLTGIQVMSEDQDCQSGPVLRQLLAATKRWCFRNHTDISGWSFLYFLLGKLEFAEASSVLEEAARLTVSLQWTNESIWVFLRTLAASAPMGERGVTLFQDTRAALLQKIGDSKQARALEKAQTWFEANRHRS